ncbi:hypothetical protein [Paenibacillus antibioticophila]|uniref:hypothetical protein n=1 Tax=Paenibacillus antibioticophila TaxID=1274374 RepID=UPI0005CB034A|nr:hypothetical protein [Paenibacillus antibioticophila]
MIGAKFYGEWLIPVVDYYTTVKKNERNYEIIFPFLIAIVVIVVYYFFGDSLRALVKLRDILPNALAILIGFTISCITILVSSDNDTIRYLKETSSEGRIVRKKLISMYQWMLITFVYILIVQVFLLAFIFFVAFVLQMSKNNAFIATSLFVEVYFILNILLLLIRSITNFYFVFFVRDK